MSFRTNAPIKSKKKPSCCEWCHLPIQVGDPAVKVSGLNYEGDFYSAQLHTDCWRAEHWWWKENRDADSWPEEKMRRGATCSAWDGLPEDYREFHDSPVTHQEALHPYNFAQSMRLQKQPA